ncbi:hypothetical protein AGABI1DRAFT_132208 [Agaricus bisporus var. burnettii JB137-S8]|uniref:Autophagy-related protein 13 n=1 Tax=Agaricus bisporus var. burnettii (strain JB137-S8 / ATCC MYA-4627 / FGSC 10392) TaxID=597362 RepID=K5WJE6_AGABU|nr:uncharacterized protein AGABI1DRAFT_132208 [Agaricus bisporus var. burnettii JB137-S8]EKM75426.1 hypothetical protein AGABI1DRAFT_132208 [Agaricus bisporus var. burnettii JB137-S8]
MEEQQHKTDQIAYHFYTKLFSLVLDARLTHDHPTPKLDKWFNLESPDSDLFTKDARELYRQITRHPPPSFDLEVVLSIPELAPNQALVYLPPSPDSAPQPRVQVDPAPRSVLLEVWSVSLAGSENTSVTPPPIYKHGMALFRSIYTLLRTLPAWSLYKRIRRRSGRAAAMSISLRLRPHTDATNTLVFHQQISPAISPISTLSQSFPPVQLPPGTLAFSVTYLATPFFEIDELESILSSRFRSADAYHGLEDGFVPTLATATATTKSSSSSQPSRSPPSAPRTSTPAHIRPVHNESIAERFILPPKQTNIGASPRDPLARIRRESIISTNSPTASPSPTTSPRQRKLSLNSSSPSSSILSQGPFLTNSTAMPVGFPLAGGGTTAPNATTTTTTPLPIRRANLNPFKSNTISSPSSSSPSVSHRTGPGPASNPPPTPSSPLIAQAPSGGQPSSVGSTHSSIHTHTRLRHASISARQPASPSLPPNLERERKMSTLSTMSERERATVAGTEPTGGSSPVQVPPPTRKRYSSSFGHRYTGSVGSATGVVAGTATSGGGQRPATPETYLHTNPDEDDISIFVQEIDSRKPLIGRAREYSSAQRQLQERISPFPRRSGEGSRSRSTSRTRAAVVYGPKEREPLGQLPEIGLGLAGISNWATYGNEDYDDQFGERGGREDRGPSSASPPVSPDMLQFRYQQQQREMRERGSPPSIGPRRAISLGATFATAHSPPNDPTTTATASSPPLDVNPAYVTNPELSTSPGRGPMLTSQEEVADRLRIMNEVFLKSLEGISSGVSGRERRRRRERELELERERESQRLFERERERQEEERRYERDWESERERERRYYYGYDEQSGLGLGFQSAEPTTTKHGGDDSVVGIGIHPSTPSPPDSLANAPPAGATDLISPNPPTSPSPSPPQESRHQQPFRASYTPTSRVGKYDTNALPSPYSPTTTHGQTSRTSLGYSQGSEEVIGRMELPDDREGRSIYDAERERERKFGIGGNRVRDEEEEEEREDWEWKEGSESVILERVEEEGEEEITPVMRILDDLGSSIELSDEGTVGGGSGMVRREANNPTATSSTLLNPIPTINSSTNSLPNRPQRSHPSAPSELIKVHHRLPSRVTPSSVTPPQESSKSNSSNLNQDRKKETEKLRKRTQVVSGAVGALVLAVAGWRIFGGNGGGGGGGTTGPGAPS